MYQSQFYSILFKLTMHMLRDCNYAPQGVQADGGRVRQKSKRRLMTWYFANTMQKSLTHYETSMCPFCSCGLNFVPQVDS